MDRFIVICAMIFLSNVWIAEAKPRPYYSRDTLPPKTCGTDLTSRVMRICQNAGGFNEHSRKRGECQLIPCDLNFIHSLIQYNTKHT